MPGGSFRRPGGPLFQKLARRPIGCSDRRGVVGVVLSVVVCWRPTWAVFLATPGSQWLDPALLRVCVVPVCVRAILMKTLCFGFLAMDKNSVGPLEQGAERARWEHHHVTLGRVPGYGFGIAVSGGRDNPHFTSGEPSIVISDVLRAGPAEGKLQINDRVVSANGLSLENVDYATAVQVLRECGRTVNLIIKRRVVLGHAESLRVTLTRAKKKDDFGLVLGCCIFVKEVSSRSLAERDGTIQEGDVVLKINSTSVEGLSLKEARKLLETSKERLQLVLQREDVGKAATSSPPVEQSALSHMRPLEERAASQNLYVQPPTRTADDKNNLSRAGRNRGPLIDACQLDQPEAPPRPALPRLEYSPDGKEDPLARWSSAGAEPRLVCFHKEGGSNVGLRLTGGNQAGVFVTAAQPGSPASLQGLQPGDRLLKVNGVDVRWATREEAVQRLVQLQGPVQLLVQAAREEYEEVVSSQKGDSFHVRAHFSHEPTSKGELALHPGEVFRVVDTLHNGALGSWLAFRLGRNHQEIQRGLIPNAVRAEELAAQQARRRDADSGSSRTSFFRRRRRATRAKSGDPWEDPEGLSKFPAYERVALKHPGFIRPVVLFGPMADVARERLLRDYPLKYACPQLGGPVEEPGAAKAGAAVRLSAIREVVEQGKHALLDVSPGAVDRLNYAQFYPIVVFLRAESKQAVKELRSRLPLRQSARKLYERALKLERLWGHLFTSIVALTGADMWYKKLRETLDKQQQLSIWCSENKPEEAIGDDFLFPVTSRLSYASSPESDLELASEGARRLGLVRASSDPSVATQEDTLAQPPPPYLPPMRPPPVGPSSMANEVRSCGGGGGVEEDYGSRRSNTLEARPLYGRPEPDVYEDPSNRPPPPNEGRRPLGMYSPPSGSKLARVLPEPPQVDRGSKPPRFSRSAQERLFGSPGRGGGEQPGGPDYINTAHNKAASLERPNGRTPLAGYEVPAYDAYERQMAPLPHDPYRFTRSTAQPATIALRPPTSRPPPRTTERPSLPTTPQRAPYQPRLSDGRPVPPPKPSRPRPWSGASEEPPPYGGPYLNLPPRSALDLSNREHRGSAFELYRKPEPPRPPPAL
ncbi:tight junction protein 1-like [Amblyomma americanum]